MESQHAKPHTVACCCPKMLAAAGQNHCRERSISFAVSGQFKVAAYTWAAKGELTLDPGEELTEAVEALRRLLAAPIK